MTQEQLNTDIAQELNKWQPIVEYSRMKIDEDNEVRMNFRWLVWLNKCKSWGLIVTVAQSILTACFSNSILYIVLLILLSAMVIFGIVLFVNRRTLKKIMRDSEKKELGSLLDDGNRYIDNLGRMLIKTSPDNRLSKTTVQEIESDYRNTKTLMAPKENRFSILNGKIDPLLQQLRPDSPDQSGLHGDGTVPADGLRTRRRQTAVSPDRPVRSPASVFHQFGSAVCPRHIGSAGGLLHS